ncbi:peptidyl-prolyl cis-trans isomerase [Salipaludibacillus sp. CF4.18]|uniref:peptidyl-prolyl cis-trans isomerase n=1 Tax=Salipaludibacillus sp. CF4.18 TaxID=3373081 RepID=UPI003EE79B48
MIVSIKGLVKHSIILDPGVWIFDDRKLNLDTYFSEERPADYDPSLEQLGKAWSEQRKGARPPQTNGNKITIDKKDLTEKSLGISLAPFISNAAPTTEASIVEFSRGETREVFQCSLEEAKNAIVAFSNKGKPLRETGPLHFYYGDGSNQEDPITYIDGITIK